MPEIPEEALQAATEALEARAAHIPYFTHRIMARIVLETGGPVLAAQARADERRKVAEEIANAIEEGDAFSELGTRTRAWAARIARQIGEARDAS